MFWTLGAKQVGKAALSGWREVIGPARRRGATLWPFDGDLAALAAAAGLVLAESYPGDAYGQIGLSVAEEEQPTPLGRAALAPPSRAGRSRAPSGSTAAWCRRSAMDFPPVRGSDDGFDAAVGSSGGGGGAAGERPAGAPRPTTVRHWEGWILGKRIAA